MIDSASGGSLCTLCLAGDVVPVIATTSSTLPRLLTRGRLLTHSRLLTSDSFFLLDSRFFTAATNQLTGLFKRELIYITVLEWGWRRAALDEAHDLKVLYNAPSSA
jgi:hypothetical protein